MRQVGWSSHFKVSRLERWAARHADMEVVEVAPVFPAGFFKLVRIRKS
jgi:phosphatidylethanolamine/phosphatidyl-N-methylethanolamine N-methyltransferase